MIDPTDRARGQVKFRYRQVHFGVDQKVHVGLRAVGLVALGLAVLRGESALALARVSPGTQELQLYGGEVFGDDLVQRPAYGGRYTFDFTDRWGVQLSAGHNPSRGARVAGGAINLGLRTIERRRPVEYGA